MVTTAPRRKTPHRATPREELDPPYDIKLVFVHKITSVLLPTEQHFLTPICTKSFDGWAPTQTPLGELSALPRPLAVFRGLLLKGGERRGKDRRGRGEEGRGVRPLP